MHAPTRKQNVHAPAMGIAEDRQYLIGDWLVSAKKYHRKSYNVKEQDYFVYRVDSMKGDGKGEE